MLSFQRRRRITLAEHRIDPDILLVRRYLAGDNNSFNELVSRYERMIYNLAYRFSGNAADAADLTQDIFILLHRKISSFRGESAFSTWFYRLAVNCSKDWVAKVARQPATTDIDDAIVPDAGDGPGVAFERKEAQALVQEAISALPDDQRIVVILHDIQGYNYDDIATILDVPLGTVKSRLNRARLKLAAILAPQRNLVKE